MIASLRNGYITSYTIYCNTTQVEPVVISAISSIEMNQGMYSTEITGLTPYTVYVCGVYANNTVDAGPNITLQIMTDEDSECVITACLFMCALLLLLCT